MLGLRETARECRLVEIEELMDALPLLLLGIRKEVRRSGAWRGITRLSIALASFTTR